MYKQDLTDYSENELSLIVFNDEHLYNQRRRSYFIDELRQYFIFTDDQLEVLETDLKEKE